MLRFNAKFAIYRCRFCLLFCFLFALVCCMLFVSRVEVFEMSMNKVEIVQDNNPLENDISKDKLSAKDMLVYILGSAPLLKIKKGKFDAAFMWFTMQLIVVMCTFFEPLDKHSPIEIATFIKAHSKRRFIASKVIITVFKIFLVYLSLFAGVFTYVTLNGLPFFEFHGSYFARMFNVEIKDCSMLTIFLFPFLFSVLMAMLQLMLNILCNRMVVVMIIIGYEIFCCYSEAFFYLGNISMLYRSCNVQPTFNVFLSVVLCVAMIIAIVFAIIFMVNRLEIIDKEV